MRWAWGADTADGAYYTYEDADWIIALEPSGAWCRVERPGEIGMLRVHVSQPNYCDALNALRDCVHTAVDGPGTPYNDGDTRGIEGR
jgi:hypothetical protein